MSGPRAHARLDLVPTTAAWETLLHERDAQYARLAAWRGEPYVHLRPAEIAVAAHLAAGFGLAPPHPALAE